MKKVSIILLICMSVTTLKSQEQTFTQMFDSVFQYVSRADATTGVLYNRVMPFSGLSRFETSDTANSTLFKQAYNELYEAAFVPTARLPIQPDTLESSIIKNNNAVNKGRS
jgi:hypothetical protein